MWQMLRWPLAANLSAPLHSNFEAVLARALIISHALFSCEESVAGDFMSLFIDLCAAWSEFCCTPLTSFVEERTCVFAVSVRYILLTQIQPAFHFIPISSPPPSSSLRVQERSWFSQEIPLILCRRLSFTEVCFESPLVMLRRSYFHCHWADGPYVRWSLLANACISSVFEHLRGVAAMTRDDNLALYCYKTFNWRNVENHPELFSRSLMCMDVTSGDFIWPCYSSWTVNVFFEEVLPFPLHVCQ